MKTWVAVSLAILSAVVCQGQSVQITGKVLDPAGNVYRNGSGKAVLVPQNQNYLFGTNPVQSPVIISGLDSFGGFSVSLTNTSIISPSFGQWQFSFCSQSIGGQLPVCFSMTPMALTVSQDISVQIKAQSVLLPTAGSSGTITAVLATPPLTSTGGVTPTISISQASPTSPGYVSSFDYNSFTSGASIPPGITYARTSLYWSQVSSTALTGGVTGSVTLTPCPVGVDYTSGAGYHVYIADGVSSEAVAVTSGSTGVGNCQITFIPFFSHTTYTIGSASSGIQETINNSCGTTPLPNSFWNSQCNVTIPANGPYLGSGGLFSLNNYNVFGTIFIHTNQTAINGPGVSLNCAERGPCTQIGDLVNANDYANTSMSGISFRSVTPSSTTAGVAVCATVRASNIITETTCTAHGFRPGDIVATQFTDDKNYWGDAVVVTVPSSTTFTYVRNGPDIASQTTPGVVALAYEAVLDNANGTHFYDINYDVAGETGAFNNFFDFWDDENAIIEHFNNNAIQMNASYTWSPSYIFAIGNQGTGHNIAPVITLRDSNLTANYANGVTDTNSNGIYIENTIIQASGLWQAKISDETGNYQGVYVKDIYSEANITLNPPCSPSCPTGARSPFPNTGVAGLIAGYSSGSSTYEISGGTPGVIGIFQSGGAGATAYTYYIVVNDWTGASCGSGSHTQTSPLQILNWLSTGSDTVTVTWPRVANGKDSICYDVIRMATPTGVTAVYPYVGGCGGGAGGICGSVAVGRTQSVACGNTLVCTYTDGPQPTSTSSYPILQGNYSGLLHFWPGSVVTVNRTITTTSEQGSVVGIGLSGNPVQSSNTCGSFGVYGVASPGGYTACPSSPTSANNGIKNQPATLMTDGPANFNGMTVSKGRLNFPQSPYSLLDPHHIITLLDCNPALTEATNTFRPLASTCDSWIGTDVTSGTALNLGKLAFGSQVSESHYIANTGATGTGWLEQLTATLKEFNVPAKFDQSVTLAALANGCLNVASGVIASTGAGCGGVNPMTTLGDTIIGAAAGAQSRLAGPTTPNGITEMLTSTPSGGVAQSQQWSIPGVQIDAQTGTTYTIPVTDDAKFITGCNAAATAWTGFTLANNYVFSFENLCAGLITYTPASGLVNSAANQIIPQNYFGFHYTDNSATKMPVMPTIQAFPNTGINQSLTFNSSTGALGTTQGPQLKMLAADYTTTSSLQSNVTGLSFPVAASGVYKITCDLTWQGSATNAGIQLSYIDPTSTVKKTVNMTATTTSGSAAVFYSSALDTTTGSGLILGPSNLVSTATDLPAQLSFNLINGVNAGTWQLTAAVFTGGPTLTIKAGSSCVMFTQ